MIIFRDFTEGRNGVHFFSSFESERNIKIDVVDSYTGLVAWSDLMNVYPNCGYFFSYPVRVAGTSFEISDPDTGEIHLMLNLNHDGLPSIESFDVYGRLKNYKYPNRKKDLWAAYPLYDIFLSNCYEKGEFKVKEGDVVFDVGANLGLFSYYSLCKGARRVYCFEPGKDQAQSIRDNFGDLPSVVLEESAVSSTDGEIYFYEHPTRSILSTTSLDAIENTSDTSLYNKIPCRSTNLYSYCKENSIEKIDYLKIDCEGREYEIVENLPVDFLSNSVDRICMEYHNNQGGNSPLFTDMVSKIKSCGFNVDLGAGVHEVGVMYAWK
jgi:FkbM family methyltransferase